MAYDDSHECPECGDSFGTKGGLKVHRRYDHGADVSIPGYLK